MKAIIVAQGIQLEPESEAESAALGALAKEEVVQGIVDTTQALMPFPRCTFCYRERSADIHSPQRTGLGAVRPHPYTAVRRA